MSTTHECPCGCSRNIAYDRYSCRSSWLRLPIELRQGITRNRPGTFDHRRAMLDAGRWLRGNPYQPPSPAETAAALIAVADLVNGTGEHESCTRQQVGRCVYCSCGQRFQGRLPKARS